MSNRLIMTLLVPIMLIAGCGDEQDFSDPPEAVGVVEQAIERAVTTPRQRRRQRAPDGPPFCGAGTPVCGDEQVKNALGEAAICIGEALLSSVSPEELSEAVGYGYAALKGYLNDELEPELAKQVAGTFCKAMMAPIGAAAMCGVAKIAHCTVGVGLRPFGAILEDAKMWHRSDNPSWACAMKPRANLEPGQKRNACTRCCNASFVLGDEKYTKCWDHCGTCTKRGWPRPRRHNVAVSDSGDSCEPPPIVEPNVPTGRFTATMEFKYRADNTYVQVKRVDNTNTFDAKIELDQLTATCPNGQPAEFERWGGLIEHDDEGEVDDYEMDTCPVGCTDAGTFDTAGVWVPSPTCTVTIEDNSFHSCVAYTKCSNDNVPAPNPEGECVGGSGECS